MRYLLDRERLHGPHTARITIRPQRHGLTIGQNDFPGLMAAIRQECQFWAGSGSVMLPYGDDELLLPEYRAVLPGSHVDYVVGLDNARGAQFSVGRVVPNPTADNWDRQLVVALMDYRKPESTGELVLTDLEQTDPWYGIYAATLGLLPDQLDPTAISGGHYVPDLNLSDFLTITAAPVAGSWEDLRSRLSSTFAYTPRVLSSYRLPHGRRAINLFGSEVLPQRDRIRRAAGPHIVVICTPGNVADHALLWNLRAAWGDADVLPVGIPVKEVAQGLLHDLAASQRLGSSSAWGDLYVTSHSVGTGELTDLVAPRANGSVRVVTPSDVLWLGRGPGWTRTEVAVWDNGRSTIFPSPSGSGDPVLSNRVLSPVMRMTVAVEVPDLPLPVADDWRGDAMMASLYGGAVVHWHSFQDRTEPQHIEWPDSLTMAEAIAKRRGFVIRESEAGRACRVVLSAMASLWELDNLSHGPLLALLEDGATRAGVSMVKRMMREMSLAAEAPNRFIGPDEEPRNIPFEKVRTALGGQRNSAEAWLLWAEENGLIVKGVMVQCDKCGAKQWLPLSGIAPPIACRGCAIVIAMPFGSASRIEFSYRISERLRRVYEHDAIGHLLVIRYFLNVMDSRILGMHPGIELVDPSTGECVGEADVLILLKDGSLIPVEVKRSSTGFTDDEVGKLDRLSQRLRSPWCVAATCQYSDETTTDFPTLEQRDTSESPHRIVLAYDALLSGRPIWAMGSDPFAWAPTSTESRRTDQESFVRFMGQRHGIAADPNHLRSDLLRDD